MLTNSLLIIEATIVLFLLVDYIREENLNTRAKRYTLVLGIFVFLWIIGYGLMGITNSFAMAKIFRIIGLSGIDGFIVCELFYILEQAKINKSLDIILHILYSAYALTDTIFFGEPLNDSFVRLGERTAYFANRTWQRTYHSIFISLMALSLILAWVMWNRKGIYKRHKRILFTIFAANVVLLLGCIPDTIFPIFNIPSWPSSAVGGFLTYLIVYYMSRYAAFDISENTFQNFIDEYAYIGIMVFGLDKRLIATNQYAERLLGIKEGEKNHTLSRLFGITTMQEQSIFDEITRDDHKEIRLTTVNGHISTLINLHVEKDDNDNPYCIYGTVIDQSKEDEMIEELSNLNEAKTQFLANMSHEIRTPVNTIMGMDEMILRTSKEPRVSGYAQNVKNSCNLLLAIINDILDFSKIESGDIKLHEEEYSLRELLNDLVSLVEERTHKKGLSMLVLIDEKLPKTLIGDQMRIRQIVTNLLTNAAKYTDYGTITLKMSDLGRQDDSIKLCIEVIDTGKGIKKEDLKTLFEAFSRVDEKRNRHIEGTGLGLSIASHFISLMGGEIGVESEYGKGSNFKVILPQKIASTEPIGDYRADYLTYNSEKKERETVVAPCAKVLIVDDNKMNLNVAALLLKETRMLVDTALSGEEALKLMRTKQYNLIFLDHMMPVMDGIEVLLQMKEEKLQEGVSVVVLTANAVAGAKEMYLEKGFDDYLSKPIASDELNRVLIKYLPSELIVRKEGA